MVAQSWPRDEVAAIDRIKNACQRPGLAEKAEYVYDRGGTDITGPTIDLLQVIATCWGNIDFGFRELSQSNGESTVECYAWDLETNAREVRVVTIPHGRYSRAQGLKSLVDPRDIYELVANNAQRRVRACLEAVIPPDIVEDAVHECRQTLESTAKITPESIAALKSAFGDFGVTVEQLQKRLGRRLDSMQPAQLVRMRAIYKSLKDGLSEVSDWFELVTVETPEQPKTATDAAKQALKRQTGKQAAESNTQAAAAKKEPAATQEPPAPIKPAKPSAERKQETAEKPNATTPNESAPRASGNPSLDDLKDYIRETYPDDCENFDVGRLATQALSQTAPEGWVNLIMLRKIPAWRNFWIGQSSQNQNQNQTAEKMEIQPETENQEVPDCIANIVPRPRNMMMPGTSLEKQLMNYKQAARIRTLQQGQIRNHPDLDPAEAAYLLCLGDRRAWQLEKGIAYEALMKEPQIPG